METAAKISTIKFTVHEKMKMRLKATAALNNKTMGDLFMDAVLEKYPYLKSEVKSSAEQNRKQYQNELEQVLKELSHSAELSDEKRNKLKQEKQKLKDKIKSLDGEDCGK